MVDRNTPIVGDAIGQVQDEFYEAGKEIANSVVGDLRIKENIESVKNAVKDSLTNNTNLITTLQSYISGAGTAISSWASGLGGWISSGINLVANFIADTFNMPTMKSLDSLADTVTEASIKDDVAFKAPDIAEALALSIESVNSGSARLYNGLFNRSDEAKAKAHETSALNAAKTAYASVSNITLKGITEAALASDVYKDVTLTEAQKADIVKQIAENDEVERYVQTQAEALTGIDSNGKVIGEHGVYHAALVSLTADKAVTLKVKPTSIDKATLLGNVTKSLEDGARELAAASLLTNNMPKAVLDEIMADDKQYSNVIKAILDKRITQEELTKFSTMDAHTVTRLAEQLKGTNSSQLDLALSEEELRVVFEENGTSFKATGGAVDVPFSDIKYQSTPSAANDAEKTPAVGS